MKVRVVLFCGGADVNAVLECYAVAWLCAIAEAVKNQALFQTNILPDVVPDAARSDTSVSIYFINLFKNNNNNNSNTVAV